MLEAWGAGPAQEGADKAGSSSKAAGTEHSGTSAAVQVAAGVTASRGACRLQHLIGAAPVVYGIPAFVTRQQSSLAG